MVGDIVICRAEIAVEPPKHPCHRLGLSGLPVDRAFAGELADATHRRKHCRDKSEGSPASRTRRCCSAVR